MLRRFHIQVGKDILDDVGILDTGDDAHRPAAGRAISIPNTRFRRCAQVIAARRSAGVEPSGLPILAC